MGNAPLDPPPGTRHHSRFFSDNNVPSRRMEMENDDNEVINGRHNNKEHQDDLDDDLDDNGNDFDTVAGSKLDHIDFDLNSQFSPTSRPPDGSFYHVDDDDDDEEERKKEAENAALAAQLTSDTSSSVDGKSDRGNDGNTKQTKPHKRSVTLPTYIRRRSSLLLAEAKNKVGALVGVTSSKKQGNTANDTASIPSSITTSSTGTSTSPPNSPQSKGNVKPPQALPSLAIDTKADIGLQKSLSLSSTSTSSLPPLPPKLSTQPSLGDMSLMLNTKIDAKDTSFVPPESGRHTRKSSVCSEEASQIRPYLYLSGDLVARNKEQLKHLKVTNVINSARSVCDNYYEKDGIEYLSLGLMDAPEEQISNFFLKVIAEIEKARKKSGVVLVHCQHGVSRSSTLISMFYFILSKPFFLLLLSIWMKLSFLLISCSKQ